MRETVPIAANRERLLGRVKLEGVQVTLGGIERDLGGEQLVEIDLFTAQIERLLLDALEVEQVVQE